jgi:hypothetical protein
VRTHRLVLPLALPLVALLAMASPARAAGPQEQAAAEVLFQDGKKLAAAGDFATACPKFAESQRLDPGSGTALHLADCYEKESKLASAWATFLEAEMMARNTGNSVRQAEATRRAALLAPRLAKLTIAVPPGARVPGLDVRRDDSTVGEGQWGTSLPLDTGQHTVAASAPGYKPWSTVVGIATDGSTASVEIPALQKLPDPAASGPAATAPAAAPFWGPQRIAGFAVGSAGLVGVVVGSVFGGITLSKSSASKSHCAADLSTCDATGVQLQQDAHTTATASNIAFGIGGAALIAGVVTFATAPSASAPATSGAARLTIGPVAGAYMTGLVLQGGW